MTRPASWIVLGTIVGLVLLSIAPPAAAAPHPPIGATPSLPAASTPPSGLRGLGNAPTPSATIALGHEGATPSAVELNWTATNDITFSHYSVLESPNGTAGSYSSVATVTSQATTTYAVSGLTPGATYWWQVTESGVFGGSSSNALAVTQPTGSFLNDTLPSGTSVWLNWTNNASYGGAFAFASYAVFEQVGNATPTAVATLTTESVATYTITGLSPGGSYLFVVATTDCLASCASATPTLVTTDSNVVTIGTPLPLVASLTSARSVVDAGESDFFTCTPSGGSAPFDFAWDFGNGSFVSAPRSASASFAAPGNVTVSCRVTDATRSQVTVAVGVLVDPAPVLEASANRTAADVGQIISFSCTSSGGTAPFQLLWAYGDGVESSGGFTAHAYTTAGSYAATCSATDGAGASLAVLAEIVVSPSLDLAASVNSVDAAPGTPLQFDATASNGSGSYGAPAWNFADGLSGANGSAVTHAFGAKGNYTVTVGVSDSNGGTASRSLSVHIQPLVVAISVNQTRASEGALVGYTAVVSGGSGSGYNLTWHLPDGSLAYGPSATERYASAGSFAPTLTATDGLGAKANTTAPEVTITAPPPPAPSYTLDYLAIAAVAIAAILGAALYLRRRAQLEAELQGQIHRIPPTDPHEVTKGAKICRNCGASNLPMRETCASCGRPLRRGLA